MNFYELTLFMTYFGQQCVNVFNFTMSGTPATVTGAFGLVSAFGAIPDAGVFPAGSIFARLRAIQSASVIYNQVRVKNPYDVTDFYANPFAANLFGQVAGDGMSPAVAYGLRSSQVRLDIASGQKRIVGVSEGQVDAGGVVGSSMATALTGLCDVLSDPITYDDEGNTLTYNLVIAKKYSDPEAEPPIINAYWPTVEEQLANIASGGNWTPHAQTRTQTSRQYGRGR